jgi:SSS family solute:Na+ symporter
MTGMIRRLLAVFLLLGSVAYGSSENNGFKFEKQNISIPINRPGMFIGWSGGALIAGGGMDEAGKPARDVFVMAFGAKEWSQLQLDAPVAWGAVVSGGDKVYVAGGISEEGITGRVWVMQWDGKALDGKGQLRQTELPALPGAVALAGAGISNNNLLVAGGTTSLRADSVSNAMYKLNMAEPLLVWKEMPPVPGEGHLMAPVVAAGSDVYIFGGFTVSNQDGVVVYTPEKAAIAYRWKPLDGTTSTGWRDLEPLPVALAGAAVMQTGQAHFLLAGGCSDIFKGDLLNASRQVGLSDVIILYHSITDTWLQKGLLPQKMVLVTAVKKPVEGFVLAGGLQENGDSVYSIALKRTVRSLSGLDYGVIAFYFVLMAMIGLYFVRYQNSSNEFSLGNRDVKWWAGAISMFATGTSSISFMAIPALSFQTNLVWMFPVLIIWPLYYLHANAIYPLMRRLELTSTYEYLERRFHPSLRYIASGQCIMFQMLGRMSVVLLLPSIAISAVTGLNVFVSVLLMGVVTTVYTSFGGFEAVVWTDVVQGLIMLFGGGLMIYMAISGLDGGTMEFIKTSIQFNKFDYAIWSWDYTLPVVWVMLLGPIFNNLAFAGDQPIVQRVFATPMKDVRRLAGMFVFCAIAVSFLVNVTGISIFSYFRGHPEQLDPAMTNDQVVPLYIVQGLPSGIAGLMIATIFAAAMSTIASSMNSVATIFTEDFYRKFKKNTTDKERLIVMKVGSLFSGLLGLGVALYMAGLSISSMFQTWNEMCALLGGGFIGIYILGMFTKRANTIGVIAGAIASIVAIIIAKQYTPMHWALYTPFAVFTCLVVGYFVSLVTPGAQKDMHGLTVFTMKRDKELPEKAS